MKPRHSALLVGAIAAAVFWRTAYPTITWWDSSQYSLAAGTLGIAGPPGSLLLTLLGWPIAHLPLGASPAHLLNLFAGVLAALATGLVYVVALRMLAVTRTGGADLGAAQTPGVALGAALGALTFAFGDTLWDYATQFTPYVLIAVFTGLILRTMLSWWEEADRPDAWRRLALLGLLFGLDFSVHRTNALLLPGALAWILLRHPRTLRTWPAWLAGAGGLVAGLAVQLLLIPIAAFSRSPLGFNDPSSWSRFWDYVSLERLGGGFLFQLFPRKAAFWSVQVADLVHVLGANFGVLPALAALGGLALLWRNHRRLAVAFALTLLLQIATTVLYFNIPPQFFRSFDRHYLPVCVTIAVLVAYGLAAVLQLAADMVMTRPRVLAGVAAGLAVLVPAAQLKRNWSARDASGRYFARDYAANALETLPPNAIYFTAGDNDTFPVMYVQAVEGVRRDVTIINLSVANLPDFAEYMLRREPSFPLAMTREERDAWSARVHIDTTVTIPVTGTAEQLGLTPRTTLPRSIPVQVKPQLVSRMLPAEITLLDIVRANAWKRPLCFAITGSPGLMAWLKPYGRPDGLFWRIVPLVDATPDVPLLRANLLTHSQYRGYADSKVRLDDFAGRMGFLYHLALMPLLRAEQARGDVVRCRADASTLMAAVPLERLALPADGREGIESPCGHD
jgi:hypothetical protein